nr:hypothetical protein [Janibacter melonis]
MARVAEQGDLAVDPQRVAAAVVHRPGAAVLGLREHRGDPVVPVLVLLEQLVGRRGRDQLCAMPSSAGTMATMLSISPPRIM